MSEVFYIVNDMKVDPDGKPVDVSIPEETRDEIPGTTLDKMKRADLEEMAVLAGMPEEEAKAAKNMGALVEFIESQTGPADDQGEEDK